MGGCPWFSPLSLVFALSFHLLPALGVVDFIQRVRDRFGDGATAADRFASAAFEQRAIATGVLVGAVGAELQIGRGVLQARRVNDLYEMIEVRVEFWNRIRVSRQGVILFGQIVAHRFGDPPDQGAALACA